MLFFNKKISEKALVGVWKHPLYAGGGTISVVDGDGKKRDHTFVNHHFEIMNLRSDMTFTFGEYTQNGPFYEEHGRWKLSSDKKRFELIYDNGETSSMDIRKFDGKSFITTSVMGNDFLFTKES